MKIKFFVFVAFVFAFSITSIAQVKVNITPKEVVYTRTEKGSDSVRTLKVTYPTISGIEDYERRQQIEKTISYWTYFGENGLSEDIENNYRPETSHSYKVNYNGKGFLDIQLTHTVYVFAFEKTIVVDLQTGNRIKIDEAFQNRSALFELIAQKHKKEMDAAVADAKMDKGEEDEFYNSASMLEQTKESRSIYEIDEFSVSDSGVTFIFKYADNPTRPVGTPPGRYFFTWAELKPYVAEYGLLNVFFNP